MNEKWKSVPSFPKYEASETGMVRNIKTGRLIKPWLSRGYSKFNLRNSKGRKVKTSAHRLVAEAFLGPIPNDYHVDHINRNPSDNNVSNLRLVDRVTNMCNTSSYDSKRYLINRIIKLHEEGLSSEEIHQTLKKHP